VEYKDIESVMKALALNGIAFKGQPLLVQASMAEKNRLAQAAKNVAAASAMMGGVGAPEDSRKLLVSELHPHIQAADLQEVFSPFGELSEVQMAPPPPGEEFAYGSAYVVFAAIENARDAQVR
jgi:RNA-binding protein 39